MDKLDMAPALAADDAVNSGRVEAIHLGKRLLRDTSLPLPAYLDHLCARELGASSPFAPGRAVGMAPEAASITRSSAPLGFHVMVVIGNGAEEQMVRIHAGGIVTTVANTHIVRQTAIGKLVSHPVRQLARLASADSKSTVSIGVSASCPKPATIGASGFVNLFPKALRQVTGFGGKHACAATVFPPVCHLRGRRRERLATMLTRERNGHGAASKRKTPSAWRSVSRRQHIKPWGPCIKKDRRTVPLSPRQFQYSTQRGD